MTLICISLMTSDVEHVFHVPVGHFYGISSSWVSCSAFQSFVYLEIPKGAFIFFFYFFFSVVFFFFNFLSFFFFILFYF